MSGSKKLAMADSGSDPTIDELFSIDHYSSATTSYNSGSTKIYVKNGIDLAKHGGMVMIKAMNTDTSLGVPVVFGTGLGESRYLELGDSQAIPQAITSSYADNGVVFNSGTGKGYTVGSQKSEWNYTTTPWLYTAYTFRRARRFFDVVTYTGNGSSGRTVSHNLGVTPGMMWVRRLGNTGDTYVYHVGGYTGGSSSYYQWLRLNEANGVDHYTSNGYGGFDYDTSMWTTNPTATEFSVGPTGAVNYSGEEYIAYLFADNTEYVECGSYNGNMDRQSSSPNTGLIPMYDNSNGDYVPLIGQWEPQFLLTKSQHLAGDWIIQDSTRGEQCPHSASGTQNFTVPCFTINKDYGSMYQYAGKGHVFEPEGFKLSEDASNQHFRTATSGKKYWYMAIRRSDMYNEEYYNEVKAGTKRVFDRGTGADWGNSTDKPHLQTAFQPDVVYWKNSHDGLYKGFAIRKLPTSHIPTHTSGASSTHSGKNLLWYTRAETQVASNGVHNPTLGSDFEGMGGGFQRDATANADINFFALKRVPKIFDVRTYIGTAQPWVFKHNLQAVPEMMMVKCTEDANTSWAVYHKDLGTGTPHLYNIQLNTDGGESNNNYFNNTAPTNTTFNVTNAATSTNSAGKVHIWMGWATYPGITKVGSYVGSGSAINVDCGFSSPARFVLVKKITGTGNWVYHRNAIIAGAEWLDSPNISGNPSDTDYIDTYSNGANSGFTINSGSGAIDDTNDEDSSSKYIYLAYA